MILGVFAYAVAGAICGGVLLSERATSGAHPTAEDAKVLLFSVVAWPIIAGLALGVWVGGRWK